MIRFGRASGSRGVVRECSGRLYHATLFSNLSAISAQGLQPSRSGALWPNYAHHAKGRVFLAKGVDAALGWVHKTIQVANDQYGDDEEPDRLIPVLLRVKRLPRSTKLRDDQLGSEAEFCSFYLTKPIPAVDLEAWDPKTESWRDVGTVAGRDAHLGCSSIEMYDEDGDVTADPEQMTSQAFYPFDSWEAGGFKPGRDHPTAWG